MNIKEMSVLQLLAKLTYWVRTQNYKQIDITTQELLTRFADINKGYLHFIDGLIKVIKAKEQEIATLEKALELMAEDYSPDTVPIDVVKHYKERAKR